MREEEIDLRSLDEVTLFTDEEHVVPKTVDFEFEQSNKIRGIYREMTIFNGTHCYQSIKNKHNRKYKYRVDIAFLNPHPVRQHHIAWKWLYAAAISLVISVILVIVGWFSNLLDSTPSFYYSTTVIVIFSVALIALLLFAHNSYDKVIFTTKYGHVKLIELLNKYPDKNEFRKFISRFIVQIRKASSAKGFTASKFLACELREIRRLRDETVVTEEEYQSAKSIIFKHSSFKPNR